MSSCYDTLFCRICCRSIKPRSSTSHTILLLRWLLVHNLLLRGSASWSSCCPTPCPTCPNWPASSAFDPQRVLLRRIFFIKSDRTKYVSVGFYPSRDYQLLVEFGVIRRGGSKSHHSQRRAYRHAGGLSTQDARFRLQWRRERGRVREWCLPPITAEKFSGRQDCI